MIDHVQFALPATLQQSGWGAVSLYLPKETARKTKVSSITGNLHGGRVDGIVFHAIADATFKKAIDVSGTFDVGYCFFENYLTNEAIDNARQYDLILTGSTYNTEILKGHGLQNVETLIQGIDPDIFNPITKPKDHKYQDKFVIFSGGKYEMRKGQDIVLAAVKILQNKYKDIVLVNCWENRWKSSFETMAASPYMKFKDFGDDWRSIMSTIYAINNIYMGRVITYPLITHGELREVIRNSDLGLFLNRCEGGTNLALMEYMACGKPVVATYGHGHKDVLTEDTAFLVKDLCPTEFKVDGKTVAQWDEPDLDEVIAQIEFAYNNRGYARTIGEAGARAMRKLTWESTAKTALALIDRYLPQSLEVHKPETRNEFGIFLNRLGLLGNAAEIGVQRGDYSQILRGTWDGAMLFLVDRWKHVDGYEDMANIGQDAQDALYDSVMREFGWNRGARIVRADSVDAAKQCPDHSFDFVYLDADHSHAGCLRDIEAWWPKVREGGILAGHDYVPDGEYRNDQGLIGDFGVRRAVCEFTGKHNLKFYLTREDNWKSWWMKKPGIGMDANSARDGKAA